MATERAGKGQGVRDRTPWRIGQHAKTTSMHKLLKKLKAMLIEAAAQHAWGDIHIDLKDGKPILIRETKQIKINNEDYPDAGYSR